MIAVLIVRDERCVADLGSIETEPKSHALFAHIEHRWPRELPADICGVIRAPRRNHNPLRSLEFFFARMVKIVPKPRLVERPIAGPGSCQKFAMDCEPLDRKVPAFLRLASIRLMLGKLCNPAKSIRADSPGHMRQNRTCWHR